MTLESPAFLPHTTIPTQYTCDGENVNPELDIKNVPPQAKSLALVMDDPDSPMGTFTHWLVWNIDPATKIIKFKTTPIGVEGTTSFGTVGYGGPCPSSGKTHRYIFKLYALHKTLDLPPGATKHQLEATMQDAILEKTELVGTYERHGH